MFFLSEICFDASTISSNFHTESILGRNTPLAIMSLTSIHPFRKALGSFFLSSLKWKPGERK